MDYVLRISIEVPYESSSHIAEILDWIHILPKSGRAFRILRWKYRIYQTANIPFLNSFNGKSNLQCLEEEIQQGLKELES